MRRSLERLGLALAVGLGAGYVPGAPGTAGSALALPLAWVLWRGGGLGLLLVAAAAVVAAGVWAAQVAERHYGVHDSPHIVVDEIAGQLIAAAPVPCTWPNLVVAFGFFRLFDSVKPWPAGWIDRQVGGGLGVVLDDVVAGLQAGAAAALLVHSGLVRMTMAWLGFPEGTVP